MLKGKAEKMLQRRIGAREHNLPVVPKVERLTFDSAAQSVTLDFTNNKKASLPVLNRRIEKHLMPFLVGGAWRASPGRCVAYVAHRQQQGITGWKGKKKGERISDVSASELNRELQILKRVFSLAMEHGLLAMKPHIALLKEAPPRSGFFEADQMALRVEAVLPSELAAPVEFAYLTGWRMASESTENGMVTGRLRNR